MGGKETKEKKITSERKGEKGTWKKGFAKRKFDSIVRETAANIPRMRKVRRAPT